MSSFFKSAVSTAALIALLTLSGPGLAQNQAAEADAKTEAQARTQAEAKPEADAKTAPDPNAEAAEAMSMAMMKAMQMMMETWSKTSKQMFDASMPMFKGTPLEEACTSCHQQTQGYYDQLSDQFAKHIADIEGHKKLTKKDKPASD